MERYVVLTDCVHIRSSASTEGEIIENMEIDRADRKWDFVRLVLGLLR